MAKDSIKVDSLLREKPETKDFFYTTEPNINPQEITRPMHNSEKEISEITGEKSIGKTNVRQ